MIGFIYLTTNLVTGKKYIGKRQTTWAKAAVDRYFGSSKALKEDIKILGIDNFKRDILCEAATREELCDLEIYYIKQYDAINNSDFYNLHEPRGRFINNKKEDPIVTQKRANKMRGIKRANYKMVVEFRNLTEDIKTTILKMYANDANIWEIYTATGFHCAGIKKFLLSENKQFKVKGWQSKWTDDEVQELISLYNSGKSCKELSLITGRNIVIISKRLKDSNIALRDANSYK